MKINAVVRPKEWAEKVQRSREIQVIFFNTMSVAVGGLSAEMKEKNQRRIKWDGYDIYGYGKAKLLLLLMTSLCCHWLVRLGT